MELWQIFTIVGFVFLILEMFTPSMFFLNFGIAAFIVAVISVWVTNFYVLGVTFAFLSLILLLLLRPFLMRKPDKKHKSADDAYVGSLAKVVEITGPDGGVVSIYDERWNARSLHGELFEVGSEVRIVKTENLVLYVERV